MMPRSIGRSRMVRYAIPLILICYVLVAGTNLLFKFHPYEIFPFFAWTLFPRTPGWHKTQPVIVVHSTDGEPAAAGARGRILGVGIKSLKALDRVAKTCRARPDDCDEAVERFIHPIVKRTTQGGNVEFSIVMSHVDMREVGRDIDDFPRARSAVRALDRPDPPAGHADKADYHRLGRVIGRWTTDRSGEAGPPAAGQ